MSEELKADREPRLRMFLEVLDAAGGEASATEFRWNPINAFCEEYEKQSPDTFNLAINLGLARSSHNSDTDEARVWITGAGRAFLARPTPHPIANAGEAMREAVARIIDRSAFEPGWISESKAKGRRQKALRLADAILSLLPSAPEGGAVSMRPEMAELLHQPSDAAAMREAAAKVAKSRADMIGEHSPEVVAALLAALPDAIRALPLPANTQAEGMALVPVEPTEAMYEAARKATWVGSAYCQRIWSAMIAASKGGE